MNVQQFLPEKQEPQRPVATERRAGIGIFFLLAGLWRLIFWLWNILIAGAIAGILGNVAYNYWLSIL